MPGDVSLSGIEFTIKGSTDAASASVDTLVNKLGQLKTALSKISSANAVVALERLKTALEQFNTGTIDTVASAFRNIGNAFAYMDASSDAISALASLSSSMSNLSKGGEGLDNAVSALTQIAEVDYQGLQDASDGLKAMATASNAVRKMSDNPENVAEVVTWLAKLSAVDFSNLAEAATAIKDISSAANIIAKTGSAAQAVLDNESTAQSVSASKAYFDDFFGSLKGNIKEATASFGKFVAKVTGITAAKNALEKVNRSLSNIVSSIGRIAFYRIIRSVIKSITESFSEGLKNAYEWSRANSAAISSLYENASEAMADFKNNSLSLSQSLDLISTVSQTMKNQLGAAFGTLLQSLTPIITYLIRLITSLASAITRLLAIIGGKSTWLQAVDVWDDWGDAASGAGGAAKEALRYLAPFDELNRLPDARAGGGGGGADSNFGDMFQEVPTDIGSGFLDTLTEAFQNVAAWFEGMDWQELGSKLWDSLKTVFTDGTKANECVKAFFEAIGSAFGAVAGFAWGFIKDAADDLITGFTQNIRDYNGDSKITAVDLLMAVLKTGEDIVDWVAKNIVDPFMNGFVRALTGDNSFDFATWFEEVVLNGFKRGWNDFADLINGNRTYFTLPKFEVEAEVTSIEPSLKDDPNSPFSWKPRKKRFETDVTAKVEEIEDDVPYEGKSLGGCIADVLFCSYDKMPEKWKQLKDCVAHITKAEDKVPIRQKTFDGKVRFSAAESKLTPAQRTFAATAQFTTLKNGLGTPKFASRADFQTYLNQLGVPEVASKAMIRAYDIATHLADTAKNLVVDSILDIVGQKNIPTVRAYVRPETGSGGGGPTFDLREGSAPLTYSMGNESEEEEVLYRAMVRALNEPSANGGDITLDGDVLYRAVLNRNKARLRAYGTNPMLTT